MLKCSFLCKDDISLVLYNDDVTFAGASNLMSGLSGSVMSMGLGDSEEDQPPGYFAATGTSARPRFNIDE